MSFQPNGQHLIAGHWVSSAETFTSSPADGPSHAFSVGTIQQVNAACDAAEEAFWSYGYASTDERAAFLNTIADEIEARADAITEIGMQESGLPEARLQGERGRTTGQLRYFADYILTEEYLDRRHDPALPDRTPIPRPDLRMVQRPVGPVAVFGASNFPLAFSTAGGDTAAALAAGCPVVVKGHPAHPGTGEIIAQAIEAAIKRCGIHAGVFSLIQSNGIEVGTHLVQHPLIKAVGFTGSLAAGRALYDLCAARPEPIPFFGELGSVNPMFLLPEAGKQRGAEIGASWAASLTMGAGQFCTNPGIAVVLKDDVEAFAVAAREALSDIPPQTMLTDGIADSYRRGKNMMSSAEGVVEILGTASEARSATPSLYQTDALTWLSNEALSEEVFGPLGLIVEVESTAQMEQVAKAFVGQLTATLHMDDGDKDTAKTLLPILERKAGRILANGFPTGVEVADSMVHGGPYPASTNFGASSVGNISIRRFLRPVCYQNFGEEFVF